MPCDSGRGALEKKPPTTARAYAVAAASRESPVFVARSLLLRHSRETGCSGGGGALRLRRRRRGGKRAARKDPLKRNRREPRAKVCGSAGGGAAAGPIAVQFVMAGARGAQWRPGPPPPFTRTRAAIYRTAGRRPGDAVTAETSPRAASKRARAARKFNAGVGHERFFIVFLVVKPVEYAPIGRVVTPTISFTV